MIAKILGIIPARYSSTRLPGKLLLPIQGKTLLQRTYENACKVSLFDELIIATDDQRIFDHVKQFGGQVIMTSSDCSTGTDRLADALNRHPELLKSKVIVNVQGDEPFVDPSGVEKAIHLLLDDPTASMATLATPLTNKESACSSSVVKCVVDLKFNALYFSRALIPSNKDHCFHPLNPYYQHIGLYVYRPEFILHYQKLKATPLQLEEDLEQLKVLEHGYRIKVAITDKASIGVDTPEDLKRVEQLLCKQNIFS